MEVESILKELGHALNKASSKGVFNLQESYNLQRYLTALESHISKLAKDNNDFAQQQQQNKQHMQTIRDSLQKSNDNYDEITKKLSSMSNNIVHIQTTVKSAIKDTMFVPLKPSTEATSEDSKPATIVESNK